MPNHKTETCLDNPAGRPSSESESGGGGQDHWYRGFVETLIDPAAMYSAQGELLFINQAFSQCFGWSFQDLTQDKAEFIPESEEAAARRHLEEALAGGAERPLPTRRLTKSGESREILWGVSLCHGQDGQAMGHLEVFRDVTGEERGRKRLGVLLDISTRLPGLASLDEVLAYLAEVIKDHLEAESSSVMLVDRIRGEIFFRLVRPPSQEMEQRFEEVRFPMDQGVAGYVVTTGQALFVPDLSKDQRFYSKVDEKTGFVSRNLVYAPLRVGDEVTGVLGALNKKSGCFSQDDVDFMVMLAHTVTLSVENARIMEARRKAERALRESLNDKEALLQEIHHRVKNNMQVIASMLGIQKMKITDPLARRAFSQSQDRIRAMAMVHESVYQSGAFSKIQFSEYVRTLCNGLYRSYCSSPRKVKMVVQVEDALIGLEQAVPLGLVLNELVTNAFKHAFPDDAGGEVRVEGQAGPDGLLDLLVGDDGVGLSAGFDLGSASGLFMVRGLVERQLKGSLELTAQADGKGTKALVRFARRQG